MEETVLPRLAFEVLKEAENSYKETGTCKGCIKQRNIYYTNNSF